MLGKVRRYLARDLRFSKVAGGKESWGKVGGDGRVELCYK